MQEKRKTWRHLVDVGHRLCVCALFAVAVTAGTAYAEKKDVSKEVGEAAKAIGEYSVEQKDVAVRKAKELMNRLDRQIDDLEWQLKDNWGELRQSTREEYQESLKSLRKQRNEMSEWYGSMKYSSKEAWEEVKKGFSNSYDAFVRSWRNTSEEMPEKEMNKEKE